MRPLRRRLPSLAGAVVADRAPFNRRPRRRRLSVAAATLAVATLVGCGGDGDDKDASRRATTTTSAGTPTTTAPGDGVPTTTGSGGPAGGAAATTTPTGKSSGVATPTTATRRPAATGGAAGAPQPAAAVGTRPGRYRYASTGTFSAGPTGAPQQRSGESILTVDPPVGADQHSLRQGDSRATEQVLRFQADGAYLVMLKLTEQGITKEFRPPTPVLALPSPAPVGRSWSWRMTSTDGQTTVQADFRVDRTESVQVGSEAVPAVVVQANLVTTGDVTSRGTQTLWVAEGRRLVVREQSVTDGTFGAFSFRSTAEERLISLN